MLSVFTSRVCGGSPPETWYSAVFMLGSVEKRISLGTRNPLLPADRDIFRSTIPFLLLGVDYLVKMDHGIVGDSSGQFILVPKDIVDSFCNDLKSKEMKVGDL